MAITKLSTLDTGYTTGALSVYPSSIDNKTTLYDVRNNAESLLLQSLPYNGNYLILEDSSMFPPQGIVRVGPKYGLPGTYELIYYSLNNLNTLSGLARGFAGSTRTAWSGEIYVSNVVAAETHNALKDAITNIENHVGLSISPDPNSLNGLLTSLETKYLAPRAFFRAYPTICTPNTTIRFQNFSGGDPIRYLWDFGDGVTSIDKSPEHTYTTEGIYSVSLNIITSSGAQGISIKNNYITVSESENPAFFYVKPQLNQPNYSITTANSLNLLPQIFNFVDQTDINSDITGGIQQRIWVFDDGNSLSVADPDIHTTNYSYQNPGVYNPSLLIVFSSQQIGKVFLQNTIIVI